MRFEVYDLAGKLLYGNVGINDFPIPQLSAPRPGKTLYLGEGMWCMGAANIRYFLKRIA